jgi:hypothetical protein
MTIEEFKTLVCRHDLTYEYSDDGSVWRRGREQRAKIEAAAKNFPREEVVKIWNAEVDRKLIPDAREQFYWR